MDTIEYEPSMGEVNLTDEMIGVLRGLTIEEQIKHFGVIQSDYSESFSYGESMRERNGKNIIDVDRCGYCESLIVRDDIIVGVVFNNWNGEKKYTFLEQTCNTYFTICEDGTGSEEVNVYCTLVWRD